MESQTATAKDNAARQNRQRFLKGLELMLVREVRSRRTIDQHAREEWRQGVELFQRRHDFLYQKQTTQTFKEMKFQQRLDEMKAEEAAQRSGQEHQEFLGYLLASNKLYELSDPEAVIQALTTLEEPPSRPLIESCRTQGDLQDGAITPVERIPEEPQDKEEGVGEGSTPPDDDTESVDIRERNYDDDDEESRDGLGEPHEDTPPRK